MSFLSGVLRAGGQKAFAFISIAAMLVFFSAFVYAVQNPDTQSSETGSSEIKSEDSQSQEKKISDTASIEKKNFSFLSGQNLSSSAANSKKTETSANTDALSVSLGLIFILILIFSMAWFMKKMGYSNLTGQGDLKIIATLNLGQKEKIALIQVGQQQLLVGMTATQINTLHVLDELIEAPETQIKGKGDVIGNHPFASKLSKFLNNKPINTK